jgi:hypothetical protein
VKAELAIEKIELAQFNALKASIEERKKNKERSETKVI